MILGPALIVFWSEINLINLNANSVDPDQMAWICWLIWIYTVRPSHKGVDMEEMVKKLSFGLMRNF
jgi:hypothetical protein